MSRKKSATELDAARCSARSKATGEQCRRWAVTGCKVCPMHGAGAPSRRRFPGPDGRPRQDPRVSRLRHGLYSSRLPKEMRRMVEEFAADEAALFDLNVVQARLWVLLTRCDEVEAGLADVDVRDADGAAAVLRALDATRRVLHELATGVLVHEKIKQRSAGVTLEEVIGVVTTILLWARELAADERVPRDQIARRLSDRVDRVGQRGTLDVAALDAP